MSPEGPQIRFSGLFFCGKLLGKLLFMGLTITGGCVVDSLWINNYWAWRVVRGIGFMSRQYVSIRFSCGAVWSAALFAVAFGRSNVLVCIKEPQHGYWQGEVV